MIITSTLSFKIAYFSFIILHLRWNYYLKLLKKIKLQIIHGFIPIKYYSRVFHYKHRSIFIVLNISGVVPFVT